MSEIVFGAGAVGGLLINADDATRRAALWLALDRGVNWIDTAPSYGDGKSGSWPKSPRNAARSCPPRCSSTRGPETSPGRPSAR